jgi:hypothetical protein
MSEREKVVGQIREILATESRAMVVSNSLFSQEGLFSQLAPTEAERRELVQTELFKEAMRRLSDLEEKEAAEFAAVIQQAQASLPEGGYRLKMEGTG